VVEGTFGRYDFRAELAAGPVSQGLDPRTLRKGGGRLVRLEILERGVPVAVYRRGWRYGRRRYGPVIARVARLLDGR
jgi:hypothetical protein